MTLLEAVSSLALIEEAALSCIFVVPLRSHQKAIFTIALLLPFLDPGVPDEFRGGDRRFWPDQARLLDSETPIEDQITELHSARILGNICPFYLKPTKQFPRELW